MGELNGWPLCSNYIQLELLERDKNVCCQFPLERDRSKFILGPCLQPAELDRPCPQSESSFTQLLLEIAFLIPDCALINEGMASNIHQKKIRQQVRAFYIASDNEALFQTPSLHACYC